jgi:hypothetical protein
MEFKGLGILVHLIEKYPVLVVRSPAYIELQASSFLIQRILRLPLHDLGKFSCLAFFDGKIDGYDKHDLVSPVG